MSDALSSSLSALTSYQRAMATTSHNVANVNTEGYSRQQVSFATRTPSAESSGFIGSGVKVTTVTRSFDEFIQAQVDETTAKFYSLDTFQDFASRVDNVLADADLGLTNSISQFMASVQDLADSPDSLSQRQLVLSEADALSERFQSLTSQLDQLSSEIEGRMASAVDQVNALAASVADLNQKISVQTAATGQPPNDLLDQRNVAINELNKLMRVSAVEQSDGQVNLYIGNGQTLVLGSQPYQMSTSKDAFDPTRQNIIIESSATMGVDITNQLSGGELGGLLDVRRDVIDSSRSALGTVAVALGEVFNSQHHNGMDLQGQLGGDFFTMAGPQVLSSANNTGSGAVTASISDVGALAHTDYILTYDGSNYQLTTSSGTPVAMTGSGTAADPFVAEGLSIEVSGSASAGDQFQIRPTYDAAATFTTAITDVHDIATAAPIRTSAGLSNLSDATISAGTVVDVTDPNLLDTVTIEFIDSNTYMVNGSGSFTYTSGASISINGWEMAITGVPQAGDEFTVESNAGGITDNRNALLLAGVDKNGLLDDGGISVQNAVDRVVSDVATLARRAELNRDAQEGLLNQQIDQQLSVQGVNLDEEAANLLKYQQAYEAAAQVMTVSNNLFETLLRAIS